MNPGYEMQWLGDVDPSRMEQLNAGKLDIDDVVLLYQDLLEAGMFPVAWSWKAHYMMQNGFLYMAGRALQ